MSNDFDFEVVSIESHVDIGTLSASPKSAAKKAEDLGWLVQANTSVTRHPDLLMVNDGKDRQRGDVKVPAHDEHHVFMLAIHPTGKVGFKAMWSDGKFDHAFLLDPLGIQVENWIDYSPSSSELRRAKDEPQWAFEARVKAAKERAEWMSWTYNDGSFRKEHRHLVIKATTLTDWLSDWLAVVNPSKAPKARPKKAEPEPVNELKGDEWFG